MKIICISGKAESGKDTVATMLAENLILKNQRVLIVHFADLLKYICKNFFKWDGIKNDKGRSLLQYIGTDIIRNKNPSYWVGFVADILTMFPNEWDYILIPDCRFPNEIEYLRKNNIKTILMKVTRSNFQSKLTQEQQNHFSETAMDKYPFVDIFLGNTGTLQDLSEKIKKIVEDGLI